MLRYNETPSPFMKITRKHAHSKEHSRHYPKRTITGSRYQVTGNLNLSYLIISVIAVLSIVDGLQAASAWLSWFIYKTGSVMVGIRKPNALRTAFRHHPLERPRWSVVRHSCPLSLSLKTSWYSSQGHFLITKNTTYRGEQDDQIPSVQHCQPSYASRSTVQG